jgi:hydrogenase small subunit
MACTMPGFPDKYMPFMDEDAYGGLAATALSWTYGPLVRSFRRRNMKKKYDVEPDWRKPGNQLTSGYKSRSAGYAPQGS